ncbi:hypothetical protein J4207_00945 [Candidatus Woesearchaeota archaeon]|nr:hypothetical protein [Candidatus Woesearchaeota archaeon]
MGKSKNGMQPQPPQHQRSLQSIVIGGAIAIAASVSAFYLGTASVVKPSVIEAGRVIEVTRRITFDDARQHRQLRQQYLDGVVDGLEGIEVIYDGDLQKVTNHRLSNRDKEIEIRNGQPYQLTPDEIKAEVRSKDNTLSLQFYSGEFGMRSYIPIFVHAPAFEALRDQKPAMRFRSKLQGAITYVRQFRNGRIAGQDVSPQDWDALMKCNMGFSLLHAEARRTEILYQDSMIGGSNNHDVKDYVQGVLNLAAQSPQADAQGVGHIVSSFVREQKENPRTARFINKHLFGNPNGYKK